MIATGNHWNGKFAARSTTLCSHQQKKGDFHAEAAQHIYYNIKTIGMSILILSDI